MKSLKGIDLVEEAVKPENHFENVDWILGNHTDELTPWIPVIAARSKANFWLLPCCFFDFFSKWNNDGKSSSQVHNYYLDGLSSWTVTLACHPGGPGMSPWTVTLTHSPD